MAKRKHSYFALFLVSVFSFILSGMKDAEKCIKLVDKFLPYVDNWATCDQMSPKIFKKNKELLLDYIDKWINTTFASLGF